MKIQRRNNKNNRRHLSIKSLALMALFLVLGLVIFSPKHAYAANLKISETERKNVKLDWVNTATIKATFAPDKVLYFLDKNIGDETYDYAAIDYYTGEDCYAHITWIFDKEKLPSTAEKVLLDIDTIEPGTVGTKCQDRGEDVQKRAEGTGWKYIAKLENGAISNVDNQTEDGKTVFSVTSQDEKLFIREKDDDGCKDRMYLEDDGKSFKLYILEPGTQTIALPQKILAGKSCKRGGDGIILSKLWTYLSNIGAGVMYLYIPVTGSNIPQANGGGGTASTGDALQTCEVKLQNPLTWIVCPMINTARELVNSLNDTINDMLTLPTNKLFVVSDTNTDKPANLFYDSWSGFRYIAMGLLVIIALIMVLSQAIGVGPFDAYTIRKVLPRLLAAVVLVSLSWPLMKLAVDITNGIGHSVSGLIYSPFEGQLKPGNPSSPFMGAVFTGVIASGFVFGLVGLLAFVATAALSMISGMATLIFREMLIMFLVVVAPVAIICSILPNTQTVWKKWSDYFLRALIVFPIFSGVIAIGQVFAVIGPTLHDGAVGDLIQFIGYFGPYFMLPKIFAMSGGAVAAVGSVAQKATAGMRGGLSNYRKKKAGTRVTNAGARLKSGDFLSRRLDRFGGNRVNDRLAGLAGGAKEGYGFGRRSETAKAARALRRKDESAKNKDLENLGVNNDMGTAIMALSHGTNAGAVAASHALRTNSLANNAAYQNADESTVAGAATRRRIEAEAEVSRVNGLAAARNVGFSRGNAQYALTAMAKSKSRAIGAIGGHELIQGGINGLSSSAEEAIQMKNDFAFNSSGAGRADFASSGNWTDEHGVAATDRVLDGFERTGLYAAANGHQNSVVAAENEALALLSTGVVSNEDMQRVAIHRRELAAMLPNANGPVRDAINHSIANLGGNAALRNWESLQAMDPATGAPPVDPATGAPITVRQPIDIARVDRNSPKFDPVYAGQYERAEIQRGYSERPETNGEVAQRMARAYERPNPNNPE